MRFVFMAPLWLAYKLCLLVLKIVSTICLLLDLLPSGTLRRQSRRPG